MFKYFLAFSTLTVASSAFAFNESDASVLVKSYSETVACQIEGSKYTAVKVSGAQGVTEEWTDQYVVLWDGDFGCAGGNGTMTPNLTVVEVRGFGMPVVLPDYKTPELPFAEINKISGKNGVITLNGLGYGDSDQQHNPTKNITVRLKLENGSFIKL